MIEMSKDLSKRMDCIEFHKKFRPWCRYCWSSLQGYFDGLTPEEIRELRKDNDEDLV